MYISTVPARRVDTSPHVTRWRAAQALQETRRHRDRAPPGGRYTWPADRAAILEQTLDAARFRVTTVQAPGVMV